MSLKHVHSLLIIFLLSTSCAIAQTGNLKGFIYEKESGEPAVYAIVYLKGTEYGVQTDLNGYFSLRVPTGQYQLITTGVGYDTVMRDIDVSANQTYAYKLFLSKGGKQLNEVTVSARQTEKTTLVNTGVYSITPKEIKLLPSAGGEPDIAQFLQVTPGVIFTGDQGGQLYIRGGAPSQTGILLDGVTIYNPFHSIGLYSVFETDAIRTADVYTAGFGAEYGNRTSAILDIRTKDGNKNRLTGMASLSPIMTRLMLEGPLVKAKQEGGSNLTFLVTGKYSYLDKTSRSLYGGLGEPFKTGLPYSFLDLYGKVTYNTGNGSKFTAFGFSFDDRSKVLEPITANEKADFHWKATGGGLNFLVTPGSSSSLIHFLLAISDYKMNFLETAFDPRSSSISGFESAIDFTHFLPGYSQIKYGIEVSGQNSNLSYQNYGVQTNYNRRNTSLALFLNYRKNFGQKFVLEPGFRLQYYSGINKASPEPRIGMKYNVSRNVRLKAAGGLYSQNIISTKSDKDIVNFFTGFLLTPDEELKKPDGSIADNNLLKAYHILGGLEVDIQKVELVLEPWFKNFTQNVELNRYRQSTSDKNFLIETGKAYGVDLSAKYNVKRVYFWGVISYQKVTRTDPTQTYPPPFDRRLNINLVGAYTAGAHKDWDLSMRYNYGSPFPFTQTQGFYEELNFNTNGIGTDYITQNGNLGLIYADNINGGRLSPYHRLDVSAKKKFSLSKHTNLDATFSITNLLNRKNVFYVNRIENQVFYQLPFFPSINLTLNF